MKAKEERTHEMRSQPLQPNEITTREQIATQHRTNAMLCSKKSPRPIVHTHLSLSLSLFPQSNKAWCSSLDFLRLSPSPTALAFSFKRHSSLSASPLLAPSFSTRRT